MRYRKERTNSFFVIVCGQLRSVSELGVAEIYKIRSVDQSSVRTDYRQYREDWDVPQHLPLFLTTEYGGL